MKDFAALLDRLAFAPSPATGVRLMADYLKRAPDSERGWALAVLAGGLETACIRPAALRELAAERVDSELLRLSLEFVGDPAETAALVWPDNGAGPCPPPLAEVAPALAGASRQTAPGLLARWFDRSDMPVRRALAQLAAGRTAKDVTPRLARKALAAAFAADLGAIEEVWHGQAPPYGPLFAWLAGCGPKPQPVAGFRPLMPVRPLDEAALAALNVSGFRAERQWQGLRVQLIAESGRYRVYSGSGDDVSASFPDIAAAMEGLEGVFDGVLMAACSAGGPPYRPAPPEALARRLARKSIPRRLLSEFPAFVRLFDILFDGAEDIRALPLRERRTRLEARIADRPGFDLSPPVDFEGPQALDVLCRRGVSLVLKSPDAPYLASGPPWLIRKAAPQTVRALLLAVRPGGIGEGGPSYSVALHRDGAPVSVGDAPCRLDDGERERLDGWIRAHITGRYGPVRAVEPALLLEVAFESVRTAPRRRSGLALERPEIRRILWGLPADAADSVDRLTARRTRQARIEEH